MEKKRQEKEMLEKRLKFYSKAAVNYRKSKRLDKLTKLYELEKTLTTDSPNQMEQMKKKYRKQQKNLTLTERAVLEPIRMIREGVKLTMMMTGHDVNNFEKKSLRMISP
ncbi:hypothetical protein NECAME_19359, partial [Necator americanus]